MGDTASIKPDRDCLFGVAEEQLGYFTSAQAHACGFSDDLVAYHARRGTFVRVRRGLYRLRHYPSSPREHVMAAWLSIPGGNAVVSHESALDLLELSDVIPEATHLTVPRARRSTTPLPGVCLHTTTRPLPVSDVTEREGIPVTSAARSIVDAAEAGTAPDQIIRAIRQAIRGGLATAARLDAIAAGRGARVRALIADGIGSAAG